MMEFITQSEREPTMDDLPFVTYMKVRFDIYELWDDDDWFHELTDKDRAEWTHWMPLNKPKGKDKI